ncbi:MAG: lamin tail domain-containing protein [Acidobacteria bacterium]|nr:lamin tail domain-containing protein [Acidobacteriota bacterium]
MKTLPLTIRFRYCRAVWLRVGATACVLIVLIPGLIRLAKMSHAAGGAPEIVINQIYGGGGSSNTTYKNDFVELFNRGAMTTSLVGWSLQYASANSGAWQKVDLSGSIAPGQYYLIQLSPGATGAKNVPAPDAFGSIGIDATAGRVALLNNNLYLTNAPNSICPSVESEASIVDFVAYGSATCYQGSGPAPSTGNASAVIRRDDGCRNIRNNSADFITAPPAPRNSATPLHTCNGITSPSADLVVTTQTSGAAVPPRGVVSFLITVMNAGPSEARNVVVTDAVPAGFTEIGGGPVIGNSIEFPTIPALAAGENVSFAITARAPEVAGKYFNRAVANSDSFDPNPASNTSVKGIRVVAGAFFEQQDTLLTLTSTGQCSNSYTVETVIKNSGVTAQQDNTGAEFLAKLSPGIIAPVGSCSATKGRCRTSGLSGESTVQWDGDVEVGEEVTITYFIQVESTKKEVTEFCVEENLSFDSNNDGRNDAVTTVSACDAYNSVCDTYPPTEPAIPPSTPVSSQKAGSILFFNLYASKATSPDKENTRINITNTAEKEVTLHQFFVSGDSCTISDNFLCMTGSQTTSFMISDIDPDVTGYLIVVAVDDLTGCPINFNYLIGDEYVALLSGHSANLGAEAFAAVNKEPCACDENALSINLTFDGEKYNQAPRAMIAGNLPSFADNNFTLVILNRVGGNLFEQVDGIGDFSGWLFDDQERALSFVASGGCQFRQTVSPTFPRTAPRFSQFVPSGHTGWMKFVAGDNAAILGSMIVLNTGNPTLPNAFSGGRNLHKATFAPLAAYKMPVFPPHC